MPQFSNMVDVKPVDFSKGTTRDEVSFYRDLARATEARRYGISVDEYIKLLRLHKSGRYDVTFKSPQKELSKSPEPKSPVSSDQGV